VHKALEADPNLQGQYDLRDPRFTARAADLDAHKGYQGWHRELDQVVADWVNNHPKATTKQFESYVRDLYSKSTDLSNRFPGGF
jgi:hypothetical protein